MKIKIVPFLCSILLLCAWAAPVTNAHAKSGDAKIKLAAAPEFRGAKGAAKFRDRGGEQEFEVELQGLKRLAGSVLNILVDGEVIGQITVNRRGRGFLNLNSDQNQTVPAVASDSLVGVTTAAGDIVLAGQF